jgi:hypothetical protein
MDNKIFSFPHVSNLKEILWEYTVVQRGFFNTELRSAEWTASSMNEQQCSYERDYKFHEQVWI